jgi:hypothetical protein
VAAISSTPSGSSFCSVSGFHSARCLIPNRSIAQGPGEQLQRIAWPGAPVAVVTRPGPAGELVYRLARPSCQTWNPSDGLRFEPWPTAA